MVSIRAALITLVGGVVALQGPNNKYSNDADDIKKMMESVRVQTEGDTTPHHKTVLAAQKVESGDNLFAGEAELLRRTDVIANQVVAENLGETPEEPPKPTPKPLSRKEGAARFFALNGMKDIGHLLGDELSNDAEEQVVKQDKLVKERLAQVRSSVAHEIKLPPTTNSQSIDDAMDFDDDDDSAKYKAQWKMVDALKARRPPM